MFNNWLKTTLLMAAIVALFGMVGMTLGGVRGMLLALFLGCAMNFWAYWNSDKAVLRMYDAQEIGPADAPEFYAIVAELAQRARLPMPRVYVIDEAQPNAFATGRNPEHAAVAATHPHRLKNIRAALKIRCTHTPLSPHMTSQQMPGCRNKSA